MSEQTHCSKCLKPLKKTGIWCYSCGTYMHVQCSRLRYAREHHHNFECENCPSARTHEALITETSASMNANIADSHTHESHTHVTQTPAPHTPDSLTASNFWSNLTTGKKETLKNVYREIVHWKPVFFILSKNEVGYRFVESLSVALSQCETINHNSEAGMLAAMVMPHLILARTKKGNDGSVSKIIARRFDLWIHCEFELLFLEAKALEDRLTKSKSKHETNEFNYSTKTWKLEKSRMH